MTIQLEGDGNFDFESAYFTAVSGRKVTTTVEAFDDNGVSLGTQVFETSDKKEKFVSLDNAIFDDADSIQITAFGGVIVDDMTFIY